MTKIPNMLDHLDEEVSDADLRAALDGSSSTEENPLDKEMYTFAFSWTDKRGKTFKGTFTNKILNLGEQTKVSVLCAQMLGGMPLHSIDDNMRYITRIIAHMTFSLAEKRPAWAENLRAIRDVGLIEALWKEVNAHESHYFRLDEIEEPSKSEGSQSSGDSA